MRTCCTFLLPCRKRKDTKRKSQGLNLRGYSGAPFAKRQELAALRQPAFLDAKGVPPLNAPPIRPGLRDNKLRVESGGLRVDI